MNQDKQRIAIAEACPAVAVVFRRGSGAVECRWRDRYENSYDSDALVRMEFDPLNDLNATHEAEKVLTYEQQPIWLHHLKRALIRVSPIGAAEEFEQSHATAAQRVEAILRTIGKWEDDE